MSHALDGPRSEYWLVDDSRGGCEDPGRSARAADCLGRHTVESASGGLCRRLICFSNHRHTSIAARAKKAAAILSRGLSFTFRRHDPRRTAASFMGEAGIDRFHIAHVLNHRSVTHSTVTAIYDRYRYDKEKRAALQKWANVLAATVGPKPKEANVRKPRTAERTGLRPNHRLEADRDASASAWVHGAGGDN